MLKKILNFFFIINNYLNREDAYQDYLKQTESTSKGICEHQNSQRMNRKKFFKLYHHKKWQKINRCC